MLQRIRESLDKREEGFTLIELLVVIIIIGILAAIAIPVFLNQRRKAWDSAAKSDVKNMATAQESYYTEANTHTNVVANLESEGFKKSDDANMTHGACFASGNYVVAAKHANSSNTWYLDSATGVLGKALAGTPTCTPTLS